MHDCKDATRVLGIDPGVNVTGYGVVECCAGGPKLAEAGVIRSSARGSLSQRILEIHQGVVEVIRLLQPTLMALEELYSHYDRPQTAILMGHARGVICLAAADAKIEVYSYAATRVKKLLTGNGRASKQQVQLAVQREFHLTKPPDPPDVADALAVALSHIYSHRMSAADSVG
jgi:crossover junction endodeoxyribonuclease RuvC